MTDIEPIPGGKLARDKRRVLYTEAQREWMQKWVPVTEYSVIAKMAGVSKNYVVKYAKKHGLVKTEEVKREILLRNVYKTIQKMKDNGRYRRRKKCRPSQACFDGNRRYWQMVKEGKALSPLDTVMQRDPQRYEEVCQKRRDNIRAAIKRERRRIMYGLERETKLRLRLNPYSKCESMRRQNAMKRGYILYEDCSEEGGERWNVYYDAETKRSEKFEKNLEKAGFHVMPFIEE